MPFIQQDNTKDEARSAMQLPKHSRKRVRLYISIPSPPPSSPPPSSPPPSSPPPSSQVSPLSPPSSPPSSSQSSATLSFTTALEESSPKLWDFCHTLPPRPASPLLWTWICHSCRHVWRLGTTQRCLHCGYRMCVGATKAKQPQQENYRPKKRRKTCSSTLAGRTADGNRLPLGWWQQNRQKPSPLPLGLLKKNAKMKRIVRRCNSNFDYTGWESWNSWRKEVRAVRDKRDDGHQNDIDDDDFVTDDYNFFDSDDDADKKEEQAMIIRPTQGRLGVVDAKNESRSEPLQLNCWNECNFPSQCKHGALVAENGSFQL